VFFCVVPLRSAFPGLTRRRCCCRRRRGPPPTQPLSIYGHLRHASSSLFNAGQPGVPELCPIEQVPEHRRITYLFTHCLLLTPRTSRPPPVFTVIRSIITTYGSAGRSTDLRCCLRGNLDTRHRTLLIPDLPLSGLTEEHAAGIPAPSSSPMSA